MKAEFENWFRIALEANRQAASVLRHFADASFQTYSKDDSSPVTDADLAADEAIQKVLSQTGIPILSEESNTQLDRKRTDAFWLIDPLDGTKEFIAGRDEFTVNLALVLKGIPSLGTVGIPMQGCVYGGWLNQGYTRIDENESLEQAQFFQSSDQSTDVFTAVVSYSHLDARTRAFLQEQKNTHPDLTVERVGSSIKFCRVIEGSADIYPRHTPCMLWDTGASDAILRSVGKGIYRFSDGERLDYTGPSLKNPPFLVK